MTSTKCRLRQVCCQHDKAAGCYTNRVATRHALQCRTTLVTFDMWVGISPQPDAKMCGPKACVEKISRKFWTFGILRFYTIKHTFWEPHFFLQNFRLRFSGVQQMSCVFFLAIFHTHDGIASGHLDETKDSLSWTLLVFHSIWGNTHLELLHCFL